MRKALYLMGILDDSDIDWLAGHGQRQFMKAGSVLIREGERTGFLYVLLEGRVAVTRSGARLSELYAGEIFGEISFVDTQAPIATVTAVDDVHVLAVDVAVLRAKLDRDQGFAARFFRALATFLAHRMREQTLQALGRPAEETDESEEMTPELMDAVSLANVRFDKLLRKLRAN